MNSKFLSEEPVSNKSVIDIINKFQNHPGTMKIKENNQGHFSFSAVEVEDVDWKIAFKVNLHLRPLNQMAFQ